jgi:hypothetical protein
MRSKMILLVMATLGMGPVAVHAAVRVGNCPGAQHVNIQDAIDASHDGNTIVVCPGTYDEQLVVYRRVRIHGLFGAMVRPTGMVANSTSLRTGRGVAAVAVVTARATIDNLDLDASANGLTGCDPDGPHLMGIFIRNSQATIKRSRVHGVHLGGGDTACDNGSAIYAQGAGSSIRVALLNNAVFDYQRAGIVVNEAGARGVIRRNTVVGWGPTPDIVQNGIQVGFGATAKVEHNTVQNNQVASNGCTYDGGNLSFQADHGTILSNVFTGNTGGVIITGNSNRVLRNVVDGLSAGNPVGLDGIAIYGDDNQVLQNQIRNQSQVGLLLVGDSNQAHENKITGTHGDTVCQPMVTQPGCEALLADCGIGLWVAGGAGNSATSNTFSDNDQDFRSDVPSRTPRTPRAPSR